MSIEQRLAELGLKLPPVATPVGAYVPALRVGGLVFVSGQLPMADGALQATGKVGADLGISDGLAAARQAALNALAAAADAAGGLDKISRIVQVRVFVNSAPGFTEQAKVANGASNLLGDLFGDAGQHVRAAVGVAELPLDSPVEVELLVAVDE